MEQAHSGTSLDELLRSCFEQATSREEFTRMEMPRGMSEAAAWRMVCLIRYAAGIELPLHDPALTSPERREDWYSSTRTIQRKLIDCTSAGVNNPHVLNILQLPEGRHVKVGLLITDCFAALEDAGCILPDGAFPRIALNPEVPEADQERLAFNYFRLMLDSLSSDFHLDTAQGVVRIYERCVEGVTLPDVARAIPQSDASSPATLALIGHILRETGQLDTIVGAIARLHAFLQVRPLPFANAFVGRLLYASLLRERGFAILSYLPIMDFLLRWHRDDFSSPGYRPVTKMSDAMHIVEGTREWTRFYEETLTWLLDEIQWLSCKLTRMEMRRSRLEQLIAGDVTYTERQHDVLIEALVHDDAEFTFSELMERYGIVYSTAHADLTDLHADGFLQAKRQGKRSFFIAAPDIHTRVHAFLRSINPELYRKFFDERGHLAEDAVAKKQPASKGTETSGAFAPEGKNEMTRDGVDIWQYLPSLEAERGRILFRGLKRKR